METLSHGTARCFKNTGTHRGREPTREMPSTMQKASEASGNFLLKLFQHPEHIGDDAVFLVKIN